MCRFPSLPERSEALLGRTHAGKCLQMSPIDLRSSSHLHASAAICYLRLGCCYCHYQSDVNKLIYESFSIVVGLKCGHVCVRTTTFSQFLLRRLWIINRNFCCVAVSLSTYTHSDSQPVSQRANDGQRKIKLVSFGTRWGRFASLIRFFIHSIFSYFREFRFIWLLLVRTTCASLCAQVHHTRVERTNRSESNKTEFQHVICI